MTTPEQLAARYGRTHDATRRTRGIVIGSAVAFVVVLVAWLWWAGLLAPSASFEAKDTGHTILSDSEVSVQWQFTSEPNTPARCAVQALNSTFGIVGWKVIDLAPSELRIRSFSATVNTTELAVTGLIYRCWLT